MVVKHNLLCPVCWQFAGGIGYDPHLVGKRGHAKFYCSMDHMKKMSDEHFQNEEDPLLFASITQACKYLDELQIHDMRYLNKQQLLMFSAIVISKYAELEKNYLKKTEQNNLDDEIPF